MSLIRKILIAGGTHGNEMTGIQLVREWQRNPNLVTLPGVHTDLLLANPAAIQLCRRYVESDMNRAFRSDLLHKPPQSIDHARAQEINQQFGQKGSSNAPDLVIDIHNSTANMGASLIVNEPDPFVRRACSLLAQEFPAVRILYQPESQERSPYLPSLGKRDLTLELGPQAHGTLRASILELGRAVTLRMLELVRQWNEGKLPLTPQPTPIFTQLGTIDYPRYPDGTPCAMVHPKLEFQDYVEFPPGSPLFLGYDGHVTLWEGPSSLWPCFIGEAAYLEKNIAMTQLQLTMELW